MQRLRWLAQLCNQQRKQDSPIHISCYCVKCNDRQTLSPEEALKWARQHNNHQVEIYRRNA